MCGIDAVEAQGCGCMFTFCHAYLKMGVLLHKMAIVCNQKFMAVDICSVRSKVMLSTKMQATVDNLLKAINRFYELQAA